MLSLWEWRQRREVRRLQQQLPRQVFLPLSGYDTEDEPHKKRSDVICVCHASEHNRLRSDTTSAFRVPKPNKSDVPKRATNIGIRRLQSLWPFDLFLKVLKGIASMRANVCQQLFPALMGRIVMAKRLRTSVQRDLVKSQRA